MEGGRDAGRQRPPAPGAVTWSFWASKRRRRQQERGQQPSQGNGYRYQALLLHRHASYALHRARRPRASALKERPTSAAPRPLHSAGVGLSSAAPTQSCSLRLPHTSRKLAHHPPHTTHLALRPPPSALCTSPHHHRTTTPHHRRHRLPSLLLEARRTCTAARHDARRGVQVAEFQ